VKGPDWTPAKRGRGSFLKAPEPPPPPPQPKQESLFDLSGSS